MNGPFTPIAAPVLDVRNMSVDIGAANGIVHAVRDVSVSVARGETLCIVGEAGSRSINASEVIDLPQPTASALPAAI